MVAAIDRHIDQIESLIAKVQKTESKAILEDAHEHRSPPCPP
jgi:uncharacterized coiled-coil protein SlyX